MVPRASERERRKKKKDREHLQCGQNRSEQHTHRNKHTHLTQKNRVSPFPTALFLYVDIEHSDARLMRSKMTMRAKTVLFGD